MQAGPELWALIPIKNAAQAAVPRLALASKDSEELIPWIQAIRKLHKLAPLQTTNPLLRRFATQLLSDFSIRHPRPLLLQARQQLLTKHIKIIGENRVKANSLEEMAWLLWNSPSHRSLLLNKDATALGFDVAESQRAGGGGQHAVLVHAEYGQPGRVHACFPRCRS